MPTKNIINLAKIQTAGQRQDKTVDYKDYYGHLRVAERYQPVDVTLTTTNTAQDLITLSPKKAAVNWFTNPSFEADDISTAWTADGAAASRVTTAARSGSNHLLINPTNSAINEGVYTIIKNVPASNVNHTYHLGVSGYVRGASAASDFVIQITDTSGTVLATTDTISLTASYVRASIIYTLPIGLTGSDYHVRVSTVANHNINIYLDDLQVEVRDVNEITDYINVTASAIETAWQGAANASPSQRLGTLDVIQYFDLTFVGAAYVAFDNVAISPTTNSAAEVAASGSIYVAAGTVWRREWKTNIYSNISFINAVDAETPRVYGSVSGRPSK